MVVTGVGVGICCSITPPGDKSNHMRVKVLGVPFAGIKGSLHTPSKLDNQSFNLNSWLVCFV